MKMVNGLDKTTHNRLHRQLIKINGKAAKCEAGDCSGKSKIFQWALRKGHSYSNKKEDYIQLCVSCHRKYDFNENIRAKLKAKKMGELHNTAKLNNKEVMGIVGMLKKGESNKSISAIFNIHPTTVCDIKRGKRWSAITGIKQALNIK